MAVLLVVVPRANTTSAFAEPSSDQAELPPYLAYVNEPDLQHTKVAEGEMIYRFISEESELTEHVTSVRVDLDPNGKALLTLKETDFPIDGTRPKLTMDRSRPLTPNEVREFVGMVERSGFWRLNPSRPQKLPCGPMELVEGLQDGRYHSVSTLCGIPELSELFQEVEALQRSLRQ